MPNSGMLDHRAYSARSRGTIHWMDSWPATTGYHNMRFSKHLYQRARKIQSATNNVNPSLSRPSSRSPNNSISPFHTQIKPSCGYAFSERTDNRRLRIGIPPTNLVAWRPTFSARAQRAEATAQ